MDSRAFRCMPPNATPLCADKLKAALQVRIGFSAFACWRAQKEAGTGLRTESKDHANILESRSQPCQPQGMGTAIRSVSGRSTAPPRKRRKPKNTGSLSIHRSPGRRGRARRAKEASQGRVFDVRCEQFRDVGFSVLTLKKEGWFSHFGSFRTLNPKLKEEFSQIA